MLKKSFFAFVLFFSLLPLFKGEEAEVKPVPVQLSDDEMHRIVLWLDCISNFYGVYEKDGGEAQLRGELAWSTLE